MATTEDLIAMCRESYAFQAEDGQRKLDSGRPLTDEKREWLRILITHSRDCLERFNQVIDSRQLTEYDDIWAWNEREKRQVVEMRAEYRRLIASAAGDGETARGGA